ncbi:MAG: hypothetical protein EBY39_11330 [Flavobacteriia bacterium]|nr:hypothetical protein [Flavobacteriia bacterium]
MKNVMVANLRNKNKKKYDSERLLTLIKAQVDNSLQFGWTPEDIILLTNFEFSYMGVKAVPIKLNNFCFTGSKVFGVKWLMDHTEYEGPFWCHDLDAWQNAPISCPDFKDAGFAPYSRPKINGGVQFWKHSGHDILNSIVEELIKNSAAREEPTLDKYCLKNKRVTILNSMYNVGCSGFLPRYIRSDEHPVKVCHFHPDNRIAWQTHVLDRNATGIKSVTPELEAMVRKYYPNLQTELDREGKNRQQEHLNDRAKVKSKNIVETKKLLQQYRNSLVS